MPRPSRRCSDTRAEDLPSVNSTATIFVGGRRKSWMTGCPGLPAPVSNTSQSQLQSPAARTSTISPPCHLNLRNQTGADSSQNSPTEAASGDKPISTTSTCGTLPISPISIGNGSDPLASVAVAPQTEGPSDMPVPPSPLPSSEPVTRPVSEVAINGDETPPVTTAARNRSLSLQGSSASPAMNPNPVAFGSAAVNGQGASDAHRDKRLRTDTSLPSIPPATEAPVPIDRVARNATVPSNHTPPPHATNCTSGPMRLSTKKFVPYIDNVRPRYAPCEQSRLMLLREACNSEDYFYLALHQIYCSWSLSQLSPIVASGFTHLHARGLEIIGSLLVINSNLQPEFVQLCSRFPAPLDNLIHVDPSFGFAIEQALRALTLFADRWDSFQQVICARNYPPLVDELLNNFGLSSSTLQGVVFSSCCRRLGADNDVWYSRFLSIFQSNQDAYRSRLQGMNTSNPVSREQVRMENDSYILSYQQLRIQQLTAAASRPRINPAIQNAVTQVQQPSFQGPATGQHFAPSPTTMGPMQSNQAYRSPYQMPTPQQQQQQEQQQQQRLPQRGAFVQRGLRGAPANRGVTSRSPPTVPNQQYAGNNVPQPANAAATRGRPRGRPRSLPMSRGVVRSNSGPIPQLLVPSSSGPNTPIYPTAPSQLPLNQYPGPVGHSGQPYQRTHLLPPANFTPIELSRPDPNLIALHEAPLKTTTQYIDHTDNANEPKPTFQYLKGFALRPSPLGARSPLFRWEFNVSKEDHQELPLLLPPGKDGHTILGVKDGSQTYQLRCIKVSQQTTAMSENIWSVTDTSWPNVVYIHVNGTEHFVRRKVHHGKDLPVDITKSIKEGSNEIRLTFLRNNAESQGIFYAVAVEILDNAVHDRVCASVQHLDVATSLGTIQKRLAGSETKDDDEIAVVGNFITIDLMDPFSARIFDVPARGMHCEHRECFDLETFFSTRLLKHTKTQQGMAEDWKCPICGRDARPHSLLIDDFLVVVRNRIVELKQDDVRAIHVSADGTWKVKTNAQSKENTPVSKPGSGAAVADGKGQMLLNGQSAPQSNGTSHVEVIELD